MPNILKVRVVTTKLENGEATEKIIDHNDAQQRQWLGKHCFWAVRNNRSVKTIPVSADVPKYPSSDGNIAQALDGSVDRASIPEQSSPNPTGQGMSDGELYRMRIESIDRRMSALERYDQSLARLSAVLQKQLDNNFGRGDRAPRSSHGLISRWLTGIQEWLRKKRGA